MGYKKLNLLNIVDRIAKDRPNTLFEQMFFDLRLKMKDLKHDEAEKIRQQVTSILTNDLKGQGFQIIDLEVKLGRFRGSDFITSAKIHLVDSPKINALEKQLQEKYSPKFKLKHKEDGIAEFNVR